MLEGSTKLTMQREMRHESVQDGMAAASAHASALMNFQSTGGSAERMKEGTAAPKLDDTVLAEAGRLALNPRSVKSTM